MSAKDDNIVIGGSDEIDEMELLLRRRKKAAAKPVEKKPEPEKKAVAPKDVTIGGDVRDEMTAAASAVRENATVKAAEKAEKAEAEISDRLDDVIEAVSNKTEEIAEEFVDTVDEAKEDFTETVDEISDDVAETANEAEEAVPDTAEQIAEEVSEPADEAEDTVTGAVDEVIDDVAKTANEAEEAVSDTAEQIAEEVTDTAEKAEEEKAEEEITDQAEEAEEEIEEEKAELPPAPDLPIPYIQPRDLDAVRAEKARRRQQLAEASMGGDEADDFGRNLLVSSSPHIHCGETTKTIMGDVLIALAPAFLASVLYFGWRSVVLVAVCVLSCVLSEFVSRRVMKRRQTVGDLSAVVTGVLLAFCLPPEINPLFAVFGSIVAIVVVKQMFGGIGMNFANPAATARIVMMLSFPAAMTTFSRPMFWYTGTNAALDATSGATPLVLKGTAAEPSLLELFTGFTGGCIGETCAVALLLGGAYLLLRGIITWEIPVTFIGTVMVFSLLVGENPLYQVLSGGVMLGAIFMATDYVTSPVSKRGKLIYGVGCGLLTMLIRLYGSMYEGVSFAILLMNIMAPLIDRATLPKPFGEEGEAA